MAPRTDQDKKKPRFPSLGAEVPQFVIEKADELARQVRPMGHPRAVRADVAAALIDVATAKQVAEALAGYNPKLGKALVELEES